MSERYSDCYFCGGEVREQDVTREVWREGHLHLVENVPVGVCGQCGEKFILPEVARTVDLLLAEDSTPDHFVRVPAYSFRESTTVS